MQQPEPHLPYASSIAQIAAFTLGDPKRGNALAARALAMSRTEGEATRALLRLLPRRAGAWLPTYQQGDDATTDRIVRVARHWQPSTRLALGLHLIGRVERDTLDQWLGTDWAAERVAAALVEVGDALDLLPMPGTRPACIELRPRLLDADHPVYGQMVRLHALGCTTCRDRIAQLRITIDVLRATIRRLFPATPENAPAATSRQWHRLYTPASARIGALVALVAVLTAVLVGSAGLASRSPAAPHGVDAATVLRRAAQRFETPPTTGITYERYRMSSGLPVQIERYLDGERLRVDVTNTRTRQTLLALVANDGKVRYVVADGTRLLTISLTHPRLRELMPMLRALPDGGAVRSFPTLHTGVDLDYIATAQRQGARLLGTTTLLDRSAYLLSYRQPDAEQDVVLTIDATTFALLRASVVGAGPRARTRVMWEAETLEQLPNAPAGTFTISSRTDEAGLPNPRHLRFGAFTNIRLADISSYYGQMPVPASVPLDAPFVYLREEIGIGVMQIYERPDATVAIMTTGPPLPSISLRRLSQQSGTTYWEVVRDEADLIQIEFVRATDPSHRSQLYVWHATMPSGERRALAESIVRSIQWATEENATTLGQRFEDATTVTAHGTLLP